MSEDDSEKRGEFSIWRLLFWLALGFVVAGLLLFGVCMATFKF